MLAFLPIIGPIIEGIVSAYNKSKDTQVALNKENRDTDVQEAQISQQIIETTQDDIGLRLMRDMAILPVVLWSFLIGYDTIVVKRWPGAMFHVENYPASVSYLPYVVLVFLFGNIGMNIWKRK